MLQGKAVPPFEKLSLFQKLLFYKDRVERDHKGESGPPHIQPLDEK